MYSHTVVSVVLKHH